jgi:hypothetical protein
MPVNLENAPVQSGDEVGHWSAGVMAVRAEKKPFSDWAQDLLEPENDGCGDADGINLV